MELAPTISQEALPNQMYNHIHILLCVNSTPLGPCPFKFELMWLEISGFKEKLIMWREEMIVEGTASFVFI